MTMESQAEDSQQHHHLTHTSMANVEQCLKIRVRAVHTHTLVFNDSGCTVVMATVV